jgi:hypothetical protein
LGIKIEEEGVPAEEDGRGDGGGRKLLEAPASEEDQEEEEDGSTGSQESVTGQLAARFKQLTL